MMESQSALERAGADAVLTYFAPARGEGDQPLAERC